MTEPTSNTEGPTNALDGDFHPANEKVTEVISWSSTFREVIMASIPTVLTNLFLFIVQLTNIYFMGRASDPRLIGAVGMGNMLINVCCFATCWGFNGTIETYVSQSFGSNNTYMCGVQLNRGRIIATIMFVPIAVLFYFVDNVLIAVAQDPEISRIARNYITWSLPGLYCVCQFDACKRYLQSMRFSFVSTYTQIITTLLHFFWTTLFISWLDLGVLGASIALNITYCSNFILQELYIHVYKREFFKPYKAPIFEEESFLDWGAYLKLAVPTTFLMCIEWWAFEFVIIFSGILGVKQLAAMVAVMNVNSFVFMFPLGCQFAASALVGNALGKGQKSQAKRFALVCVIVCVSFVFLLAVLMNIFKRNIALVFTKDEGVIYKICEILPLLSVFIVLDSVHGVQAGNVRALGRQQVVSLATLICYYLIGLPLALYLGFSRGWELVGFWTGYIVAMFTVDCVVVYMVVASDWRAKYIVKPKSQKALERLGVLPTQDDESGAALVNNSASTAQAKHLND